MSTYRRGVVHVLVSGLVMALLWAVPSTATAAPSTAPAVATPAATAAATAPLAVRVQGNTLVDGAGNPMRLLGVNRSGAEYACVQGWGIFDGPTDATSIAAMAAWHINAVRVPLNEDCWLAINGVAANLSGASYRSAIATYVTALHNAGLIVILDLHWNAPGATPANQTGQQVMADADHSPAFWASVSSYFKNDPAVVFDLYNEPHDISWSCWRDGCLSGGWQTAGMQQLLNAVRSSGATQPVLLGGLGYSSDLSSWLTYRPTDPANQVAASYHLYNFVGCDASCWPSMVTPVAASVPVVTGEIGENDCASGFIAGYMAWADAHGVSYLGWTWDTWDCSSGPALISNYDGTPTAFGAGFRDHLAALAAAGPSTFTYPTAGQSGVDTTKAFTWTASTGAQAYYLLIGTSRYGYDLVNSGVLPATQTSYSEYVLPTGKTLYATLLTEQGGTWRVRDISFTAAPGLATMTYPLNGQLKVDTSKPFTWSTIPAGQGYILVIGTVVFGADLFISGILPPTQSSVAVPALPAGKILFATLFTKVNGAFTRYQLIAFTA